MATQATNEDLQAAFKNILTNCKNEYAKEYTRAVRSYGMTGHELCVQILYILSNLSHWRGDLAKDTKAILKSYYNANNTIGQKLK